MVRNGLILHAKQEIKVCNFGLDASSSKRGSLMSKTHRYGKLKQIAELPTYEKLVSVLEEAVDAIVNSKYVEAKTEEAMRMIVNHLLKHPCEKDWLVALI